MADVVEAQMRNFLLRRQHAVEEVLRQVRPLVAVLKDAGRTASAEELAAALFQLDAVDQEMVKFARENMAGILGRIFGTDLR